MAFLEGRHDGIRNRLQAKLETAAERLDFEDAARLRDAMRTVTTVANTHQTLAKQIESGHLVLALPSAEPDCTEALLIVHGRVAAQRRITHGEPAAFVAEWLLAAYRRAMEGQGAPLPIVVAQDDVDELHIIERWLHHHAHEPGQFPLPEERDAVAGWTALAESLVAYDAAAEDWTKADLDAALVEDDDEPTPTDE